jgi:hypothetical protein
VNRTASLTGRCPALSTPGLSASCVRAPICLVASDLMVRRTSRIFRVTGPASSASISVTRTRSPRRSYAGIEIPIASMSPRRIASASKVRFITPQSAPTRWRAAAGRCGCIITGRFLFGTKGVPTFLPTVARALDPNFPKGLWRTGPGGSSLKSPPGPQLQTKAPASNAGLGLGYWRACAWTG